MYELQGSIMTRGQVNVTVSALQVALAVFLWWYAPLQVRETQEAAKAQYPNQHIQLGLDFYRRIEPGPAERVAFALNFPALILSIPVANFFPEPLYESNLRLFSPMDLAFFVWTGILWYWLALRLTALKKSDEPKKLPKTVRIIWLACGVLFALILGAAALSMLLSRLSTIPYKQVAPFGLLWSLGLASYFAWQLKSEWET